MRFLEVCRELLPGSSISSSPVFCRKKSPIPILPLFAVVTLLAASNASALLNDATVTLAWDPSPDQTVMGYRVHYGTVSNVISVSVDVGRLTQVSIPNLSWGFLYYFTVTAYNSTGVESDDSNQVSYLTGGGLSPIQVKVQPNRQVLITGTGQAGKLYTIQSSTNLINWTTRASVVAGVTGSYQYTDTTAPNFSARFYRVRTTLP